MWRSLRLTSLPAGAALEGIASLSRSQARVIVRNDSSERITVSPFNISSVNRLPLTASVLRYDSACYLALSEVKAKHFRQNAANSINLTLCNQKHRLFFYLLGKCFAPTNPAESLGNRKRRLVIANEARVKQSITLFRPFPK